jgi:cytoskeletal protein RodZ
MTKAGFGEHLKREREMRGVSLEEIAGATRISTRFLHALENEAWDRLPGGVFNRGFVRTVARFLGLEEENLLAEYALATRVPGATTIPAEPPHQPSSARRAPWIALGVAVILALGGAGWYGWRWFSARHAELNAAASALPVSPAPPPVPAMAWTAPVSSPAPSAASPRTASPWAGLPPAPADIPQGVLPRELQLKIDAEKETYLTVTSDGQRTFAGTILAGESRNFSAVSAFTVEAQDAGAIRLELNGQTLTPIGPLGQPGKITLGRRQPNTDAGGPN